MEQNRKQYYRITNSQTGECVAENLTAADVSCIYGVHHRSVSNYASYGKLIKGLYRVEKQNVLPEKIQRNTGTAFIWQDWEKVTESIKSKVIWCKKPEEGVRRLYIGRKRSKREYGYM